MRLSRLRVLVALASLLLSLQSCLSEATVYLSGCQTSACYTMRFDLNREPRVSESRNDDQHTSYSLLQLSSTLELFAYPTRNYCPIDLESIHILILEKYSNS